MLRRISLGLFALVMTATVGVALTITGTDSRFRQSIFEVGILRVARDSAITATPSGSITTSYLLTAGLNRVATVASAADGVRLPECKGGKQITVINAAAANAMNVFPYVSTETINALTAGSAFSVAANKTVQFSCAIDGKWYSNLTA